MGYKVQFENGHTVEFDSQPSEADIDEAFKATASLQPKQNSGIPNPLDMAGGVLETATTGTLGAIGGLGAQVYGSIKGMLDPNKTASQGMDEALQSYSDSTFSKLMAPQTETGKFIEHGIGTAIQGFKDDAALLADQNPNSIPLRALAAGMSTMPEGLMVAPLAAIGKPKIASTPKPKTKGVDVGAYKAEEVAKEVAPETTPPADRPPLPVTPEGQAILSPQDAMFKAEAERKAKLVEGARPVPDRDLADPFGSMKQQLDVPQQLPPLINPAIDRMVNDLQRPPMNAEAINRATEADRAIAERQAAMEQQVRQSQSLDFNAAERARQEQAPVPGLARAQEAQARAVQTAEDMRAGAVEMESQKQMARATEDKQAANVFEAAQLAENLKKADEAQAALEARQREIEFNVKRQQQLDFNAAERARQEQAEVPGLKNFQEETKYAEVQNKVAQDPKVVIAEQRLAAAEDSLAKAQQAAEQGKVTKAHLKTLEQAVKDMKESLDWVRSNVEYENLVNTRKTNRINSSGRFGRQRGAFNPNVLKDGFEKVKALSNGLRIKATGVADRFVNVQVLDAQGNSLANMDMTPQYRDRLKSDVRDLVTDHVMVYAEGRHKGLAQEMYKFVSELGNDIRASETKTEHGKAMWDRMEKNGLAKDGFIAQPFRKPGGPGGRQGGWIRLEAPKNNKEGVLSSIPGIKKHLGNIAKHFYKSPEEVIEAAKTHGDMNTSAITDQLTKGGQYQKLKTDNPIIHYGVDELIQKDRQARADIRDYVHDELGTAIRNVPKEEKADIWALISDADMKQKELDPVALAKHGATEAQLEVVRAHREVMDYAFNMVNRALRAMGKPEIDKRTAYAAMRSTGDFRRLVYDKEGGDVIGVLGSNFRHITNRLAEQMTQKGFFVGEEKYMGGVPRERGSAHEAFMNAVEFLAQNDPKVQKYLDTMDEIRQTEMYNFLNMKTHTMAKKGVFGMEGRKPWKDAYDNAIEGFEQQMRFAESAIRWGHLSEAITNIKRVIDNPEIAKQHPRAVKWMEDYIYNSLGFNPSKIGRGVEQAVANMFEVGKSMGVGVGYSNVRHALSIARQTTNAVLLGLNPRFWLTQFVQPFQNMPGMKASLIAKGLDANFDFGTGYSYLGKGAITAFRVEKAKVLTDLEYQARKYARENHVYGDDLIEHSNRASKDAVFWANKVSNFGTQNLESATRRTMFYSMVHMLADNGMSPKNGLFEAAHQLTDMTMVNYSAIERPKIYNHFGPLGDTAINLQNYKHNEMSRLFHYVDQISRDKSARPLAAQLASGFVFAGITGMVGYAVADEMYKFITKKMGNPDSLTALIIRASEDVGNKVNSLTGRNEGDVGDFRHVISHGGPSLLGIDLSRSLGMQDLVPNGAEILFPGHSKLGAIAGAGYDAVTSPSEMNTKRFIREASPGIVSGIEDRAWFSTQTETGEQVNNRKSLESNAVRNDKDKIMKMFGATGINENVQKQKRFEENFINQSLVDIRKSSLEKARDKIFTQGMKANLDDELRAYLKAQGNLETFIKDVDRYEREQSVPAYQADMLRSVGSRSIARLKHAQRLLEMYKK